MKLFAFYYRESEKEMHIVNSLCSFLLWNGNSNAIGREAGSGLSKEREHYLWILYDVQTKFWLGIIRALLFNILKIHRARSANSQTVTLHFHLSTHRKTFYISQEQQEKSNIVMWLKKQQQLFHSSEQMFWMGQLYKHISSTIVIWPGLINKRAFMILSHRGMQTLRKRFSTY